MKNLIIVATSTLCVLLVAAVPLPSSTNDDVKLVQIPLEGNKVSITQIYFILTLFLILSSNKISFSAILLKTHD